MLIASAAPPGVESIVPGSVVRSNVDYKDVVGKNKIRKDHLAIVTGKSGDGQQLRLIFTHPELLMGVEDEDEEEARRGVVAAERAEIDIIETSQVRLAAFDSSESREQYAQRAYILLNTMDVGAEVEVDMTPPEGIIDGGPEYYL
jgi:hypothetical protein